MNSSEVERAAELARRLCGEKILAAERWAGGGNNRVFRVRTPTRSYALKCYATGDEDKRDRLAHEFDGLRVLQAAGIRAVIPSPVAADREARCALYEWIDGTPAGEHGSSDIAIVLRFLASLHRVRGHLETAALPPATEATLALGDLLTQVEIRLARLEAVLAEEPRLREFLEGGLKPEFARRRADVSDRTPSTPLTKPQQTLSPSDFGFHNALRRPDGTLTFIDFEYFGWDDPVKLTADFLWHPGMALTEDERLQFLEGATDLYGDDPDFRGRLTAFYPLHGLRWCLIVLNEFLPSHWRRRMFAGATEWEMAKERQLGKAMRILSGIQQYER